MPENFEDGREYSFLSIVRGERGVKVVNL